MFTHKNLIQSSRSGLSFLKGATFFFLGMSLVLFAAKATFEVVPSATNVSMILKSIRLTADGTPGTTGVYLDGSGGLVEAETLSGNTVCINGACETSRPSGGGTPGGTTNAIQFNDGSTFSGSTGLVWNSVNGQLGVGISSPSYTLDINGTGRFNGDIIFGRNQDRIIKITNNKGCMSGSTLNINASNASNFGCIFSSPYNGGDVVVNGGAGIDGGSYGNVILANQSGNVGIGTASPDYKLHLSGGDMMINTTKKLLFGGLDSQSTNFSEIYEDGLYLYIKGPVRDAVTGRHVYIDGGSTGSSYGNVILANDGGNVGIGTDNPQAKLHVAGTGLFDGNVGIGTTTPSAKLHVAGSGKFEGSVQVGSPASSARCNTQDDVGQIIVTDYCASVSRKVQRFVGCAKSGTTNTAIVVLGTGGGRSDSSCLIVVDSSER